MKMRVKMLSREARPPTYATEGAAGLDLYSPVDDIILPGARKRIETGVAIELPTGHEGQVRPRSGAALKKGLSVVLGTIDEDYRGEIGVVVFNISNFPIQVARGDRIAQLVVAPITRVEVELSDDLSTTTRGAQGFGSTGR